MTETIVNQGSSSGHGFFNQAQNTNASGSNFVELGHVGHLHITNINNRLTAAAAVQFKDLESLPPFTDAPDLLSVHFTGRDKELEQLKMFFSTNEGTGPTRCAIYGMPGLGKTQLALKFATMEYARKRFSHVFWISSTTMDKLHAGFEKVLGFISHSSASDTKLDDKLLAVRRWFEDSGPISWLIVFDNVGRDTHDFFREHIPRQNEQGRILYTTRTQDVAKVVTSAAGHRHHIIELGVLDVQDAAKLFLDDAEIDTDSRGGASAATIESAEQLVNCIGRLPLAIVQAASFKRCSPYNVKQILTLYQDATHKAEIIKWENELGVYEEKSVAAVFSSLLERVIRDDPVAGLFLKLLSFFDPESIAVKVVVDGAQVLAPKASPAIVASSSGTPTMHYKFGVLQKLFRNLKPHIPCVKQDAFHIRDDQLSMALRLHL